MSKIRFDKMSDNPEVRIWHDIWVVKVSDVGDEFSEWLYGQTLPYVEESDEPTEWAYYVDYSRWIRRLPVID